MVQRQVCIAELVASTIPTNWCCSSGMVWRWGREGNRNHFIDHQTAPLRAWTSNQCSFICKRDVCRKSTVWSSQVVSCRLDPVRLKTRQNKTLRSRKGRMLSTITWNLPCLRMDLWYRHWRSPWWIVPCWHDFPWPSEQRLQDVKNFPSLHWWRNKELLPFVKRKVLVCPLRVGRTSRHLLSNSWECRVDQGTCLPSCGE